MQSAPTCAEALAWLRNDLAGWWTADKTAVGTWAQYWHQNPDLKGVRGDAALAKLPEAERREWRKLWEDVEALRKRAADPQPR